MDPVIVDWIIGALGLAVIIVLVGTLLRMWHARTVSIKDPNDLHDWMVQALKACVTLINPDHLPENGEAVFPDNVGPAELARLMNGYFDIHRIDVRVNEMAVRVLYADMVSRSWIRSLNTSMAGAPVYGIPRTARPTVKAEVDEGEEARG